MDAQQHYRQQSVETATPGQLISMLYHGAVAAVVRGGLALDEGRLDAVNRELQRAQDIVIELRSSLDFTQGGAIARNLDALYDFCLDRLITANIRKDRSLLDGVRDTLADMAATWDEMLAQQSNPAGAGGASFPAPVGVGVAG